MKRKAGWDTHGLPIELAVEKTLGITKEDIGKKISIEEYNKACRKEVLKYQDRWEELTRRIADVVNAAKARVIDTLGALMAGFFSEPSRIARDCAAAATAARFSPVCRRCRSPAILRRRLPSSGIIWMGSRQEAL